MLRQYNEKVQRDQEARDRITRELYSLYGLKLNADQRPSADLVQQNAPSEEGAKEPNTPTPA
jgi:hypothetical protein